MQGYSQPPHLPCDPSLVAMVDGPWAMGHGPVARAYHTKAAFPSSPKGP